MGYRLITAAAPVVATADVKAFLRVEGSDEDALVAQLAASAAAHLEQVTGRSFGTQTWELQLDRFGDATVLGKGPVQAIASVKYIDPLGAEQTLPADGVWQADLVSDPSRLLRRSGQAWPAIADQANAVRIRFTAGFDPLPAPLRQAVLLLAGHWYANREAVITGTITSELPLGVENLIHNYRVWLA